MKRYMTIVLLPGFILLLLAAPVKAQTATPPAKTATPPGVVTGTIVNHSRDGATPPELELMVHAWDQTTDKGMFHGKSRTDGSFRIENVPLEAGSEYLVMAVYNHVTYTSQPVAFESGNSLNIDVPVYDSATDLSQVQVDQMHVLLRFAPDGLEVKEIYLISNRGDRTINEAIPLDDGSLATLKFPLPDNADYIFFDPDSDRERFVKFAGGFADKDPLLPGDSSGQFMVSYLLPYTPNMPFTYKAPLDTKRLDFLVPEDDGMILTGLDLGAPRTTTLQNGSAYLVYSYLELRAGKTVSLSISGTPKLGTANGNPSNFSGVFSPTSRIIVETGAIILGFAMVAFGIWRWRRNEEDDKSEEECGQNNAAEATTLDDLIVKIARLDSGLEKGEIQEDDYRTRRASLVQQAKEMMHERAD